MKRRAVLSVVAGGLTLLSGCGDLRMGTNRDRFRHDSQSSPEYITVSNGSFSMPDIATEASTQYDDITDTRPPRILLSIWNEGEQARDVYFSDTAPFNGTPHSDLTGLYLYPPTDAPERREDCWQTVEEVGPGDSYKSIGTGGEIRTLQPGERVEQPFEVWADPRIPRCYPEGTYTFEAGNYNPDSDRAFGEPTPPEYRWSFDVTVHRG